MKNSMRFIGLLGLTLAFLASTAFAQTATTGSIAGTVLDVNRASVPGVTVTVTSPNLIGARSAVTGDDGRYNIGNLPPGRYMVSVEATSGFGRFEKEDVEVNLSKTSTVEVQLQPAGAQATVTVTDTSGAAVDVTSTTRGSNVSTDQFSNFPTSRTVQGLYNIAPTVVRSGLRDASGRERDPSVGGSSGPENNYILDGVNTTDPAFGGSGANIPFEFVQEVEVKSGAYGAEYGRATGGIFNVITKSGTNEFHGDIYGYFTHDSFVRETKFFPFTGSASDGFDEQDIGGDIGGPIIKDKLWFFGAFNPQRRNNNYLTQTLLVPAENKVRTPFYAGKLTWGINQNHTASFSTFGDFTTVEGFLATGALTNVSGYGDRVEAFEGRQETGGHNYAFRLNSSFSQNVIGEFSGGLHFQRANTLPVQAGLDEALRLDNFAVLRDGAVLPVTQTGVMGPTSAGFVDFVDGRGGELTRNFFRGPGFGLFSEQDRNRYEIAARMQAIWGAHTFKFGFEWNKNIYNISTASSGPSVTFGNPLNVAFAGGVGPEALSTQGYRVTNNFSVCTTRGSEIVCPSSGATAVLSAPGLALPAGLTSVSTGAITEAEAFGNPFLVRLTTRVRDFQLQADTYTAVQGFYVQDDFRIKENLQINLGLRWDYQQAYSAGGATYITLNDFVSNTQPRIGFIWDFTGTGRGKLSASFSRYLETPLPLDINVRAGGGDSQTDKNFNVDTYGAPAGSNVAAGFTIRNLGASATPIDPGLKPQTVNEFNVGFEYEVVKDLALAARGIYRSQDHVIEDGSFDDGNNYFIFNPGRRGNGGPVTTEDLACAGSTDPDLPFPAQCFGRARRYYRALEFSATKRFTNNYQFIASYVYSSLIGNYEGLFRNDNGQSDPNITSLFDLVSLLNGLYGRLPNDRPHVFKFNGSYRTPWKLVVSGNYYAQSGIPFNQLIPHPVYGNNEGFGVPRGTAIIPNTGATVPGGSGGVDTAIGSARLPFTQNLDLGAYYPIVFSENKQLRFQVDWFNVMNSQRALTLDQTFQINSGVTGVPPVNNPFFGSGLIFQFPSSLRLGVKFQF